VEAGAEENESLDISQFFGWRNARLLAQDWCERLPLCKFVLDGRHQQAARPAHHSPVVFVGRSASQADLVMTSVVVDARPREAVRATLPKQQLQESHELT